MGEKRPFGTTCSFLPSFRHHKRSEAIFPRFRHCEGALATAAIRLLALSPSGLSQGSFKLHLTMRSIRMLRDYRAMLFAWAKSAPMGPLAVEEGLSILDSLLPLSTKSPKNHHLLCIPPKIHATIELMFHITAPTSCVTQIFFALLALVILNEVKDLQPNA